MPRRWLAAVTLVVLGVTGAPPTARAPAPPPGWDWFAAEALLREAGAGDRLSTDAASLRVARAPSATPEPGAGLLAALGLAALALGRRRRAPAQ